MNRTQKIIAVLTLLVIILMMIYPPFITQENLNAGYSFITDPPEFSRGYDNIGGSYTMAKANINVLVLAMQFFVALLFGSTLFFVFKSKDK